MPIAWLIALVWSSGAGMGTPSVEPQSEAVVADAMIQWVKPYRVTAGETTTFWLASSNDDGAWIDYSIDWDGSGNFQRIYRGTNEPTQAKHAFASPGVYTVTIVADLNGVVCPPVTRTVTVDAAQ